MKTKILIIFLFFSVLVCSQELRQVLPQNVIYTNSDTIETQSFPIYYDSLQVGWTIPDSIDVDVYLLYSVGGFNWNTSDKIADIVMTTAGDTSIQYSVPEPSFYGKLKYIYNSSGNDTDTTGYFNTYLKQFKTGTTNY
jgi:hypothetical protein